MINISKIIGKGYKSFWNSKKRYVIIKGSRGSKKSTTTSIKLIYNLLWLFDSLGSLGSLVSLVSPGSLGSLGSLSYIYS